MNEINLKTSLIDIIEYTKDNESITKAFLKANSVIKQFNTPYCSISGGKDSDVMLDIIYRVDYTKKVKYVFFDTGIEYNATKQHLDYLENKYGIIIERLKSYNCQVLLTTHNTSIFTNDLLRPDCYYICSKDKIENAHNSTVKELRFGHNLEKLYRGGTFGK
jgi:3'-phosphoadenosine 5'-phosphosulfate sulfotransferase (PAPS reductase)/FAD synthetase